MEIESRPYIDMAQHLLRRPIPDCPGNPLLELSEIFPVKVFGDVTADILRALYGQPRNRFLFWRLVKQLAFFGVIFRQGLSQFSILEDHASGAYLWSESSKANEHLVWTNSGVQKLALQYGVALKKDIVGVSVQALQSLEPGFLVEPMVLANNLQVLSLEDLVQKEARSSDSADPLRFTIAGCEILLSRVTKENEIVLPKLPALAKKLNSMGYHVWGDLPPDLDSVLHLVKGVGGRSLEKFLEHLKSIAENDIHVGGSGARSGRTIAIPAELAHLPCLPDVFPECATIMRKLRDSGIFTVGQLASQEQSLLEVLDGVGPKHIDILAATLQRRAQSGRYPDCDGSNGKVVWFLGDWVAVSGDLLATPISELCSVTPAFGPAAQQLRVLGYTVIGDLPTGLGDITDSDPLLRSRTLKLLFRSLKTVSQAKSSNGLILDPLVTEACGILDGVLPSHLDAKKWKLLEFKLNGLVQGRIVTLAEIGDHFGITRERVRQVLKKVIAVLVGPHWRTVTELKSSLLREGQFLDFGCAASKGLDNFRLKLFLALLLEEKGIYLDVRHAYLTTLTQVERESLLSKLKDFLEKRLEGNAISAEELEAVLRSFCVDVGLSPTAVSPLREIAGKSYLVPMPNDKWSVPVSKRQLAAQVFREMAEEQPGGVSLYEAATQLRVRANQVVPGAFDSDHSFITALQRNDDVVLWGWGIYTHRSWINVTASDIAPVAQWILGEFQRGVPQLSARAAFIRFRADLEALGVGNEHALYSCLRLFYEDQFSLPKCPRIFPTGQREILSYSRLVEMFLQGHGPSSHTELRSEFIEKRGWQPFQLGQALATSAMVIRTGRSSYGLTSSFPVDAGDLATLADALESKMSGSSTTVSILGLFKERKATCFRLGIPNEYVLYGLMADNYGHRFIFSRFPHVTKVTEVTEAERSNKQFVLDYLLSTGGPVLKEQLRNEFEGKRHWTVHALDNALVHPDVLPVHRGAVSEYVHRDVLDWSDGKQSQLENWVRSAVETTNGRSFPFGNVERDLLIIANLPKLGNGVEWTPDLLKTFLGDLDFLVLLGTKQAIFASFPNEAGVEDDDSFLTYLLQAEFGGAAKVGQFERRLFELEFRSSALKTTSPDEAPYCFFGDEILLRR